MPKKPNNLDADLEALANFWAKHEANEEYFLVMQRIEQIEDSTKKEELPLFVGALFGLETLLETKDTLSRLDLAWSSFCETYSDGSVRVPVSWLKAVLKPWEYHCDPDSPVPFEKAAGIEGEGNGRKARSTLKHLKAQHEFCRLVLQEKVNAQIDTGQTISDKEAIGKVVNLDLEFHGHRGTESVVERSWNRWGGYMKGLVERLSASAVKERNRATIKAARAWSKNK